MKDGYCTADIEYLEDIKVLKPTLFSIGILCPRHCTGVKAAVF